MLFFYFTRVFFLDFVLSLGLDEEFLVNLAKLVIDSLMSLEPPNPLREFVKIGVVALTVRPRGD